MALGAVVLVAGLAMVAVGLFVYLGGGDSAPGSASTSPEGGERAYVRPSVATQAPTGTPASSPTPKPPPLARDVPYRMIIEEIGVEAPVETYGLDENSYPEVPNYQNSSNPAGVVAWYDFSAQPGSGSNAVFAGHVTWNGRAVFYDLHELRPGDTILLAAQDGARLEYVVSDAFTMGADDPKAVEVMWPTPTDTITLITCSGTWIPDPSDTVAGGEYTERLVVRATLVKISTGAPPAASAVGG